RAGRRDAPRLPHLGARRRVLWLALFLLGQHGGRQGAAAAPGPCGRRHRARLCARRPYGLAGPVLASGGHLAGTAGRHGDRPAWLVEPLQALGIQGDFRAVREWRAGGKVRRYPDRLPLAGAKIFERPPGRRDPRQGRRAARGGRCGPYRLARDGRLRPGTKRIPSRSEPTNAMRMPWASGGKTPYSTASMSSASATAMATELAISG